MTVACDGSREVPSPKVATNSHLNPVHASLAKDFI